MKANGTLSERQARILSFVYAYHARYGMAPGRRDIADGAGISSTSVVDYNLRRLEEMGCLRLVGGRSRGILLPDTPRTTRMTDLVSDALCRLETALDMGETVMLSHTDAEIIRAALETAGASL